MRGGPSHNLAYRWFCRLGLEGAVPDHSTFSKNRHGRFRDSGCLRWVFGEVLRGCMSAGLIKGKGFAVDASLSKADANRQRAVAGSETIDWGDRRRATRAVREYLDALEADPSEAPAPKSISLTDPLSQWTAAANGAAFFAYSTNYLIDTAWGIILDVQATTANRAAEVESTKTMLERVEAGLGITPERLIGDTAYGTAPMLGWLVEEKGIDPHVPVWDKSERTDGSFSCSEFRWDAEANTYTCPAGKQLRCDRRNFTQPHHTSPRPIRLSTARASLTASRAPSRQSAAPIPLSAGSPAASMKGRVPSPGASPRRPNTNAPATSARKSRCSLPTSSASCAWTGCACADSPAPAMNSPWPPPRRTCAPLGQVPCAGTTQHRIGVSRSGETTPFNPHNRPQGPMAATQPDHSGHPSHPRPANPTGHSGFFNEIGRRRSSGLPWASGCCGYCTGRPPIAFVSRRLSLRVAGFGSPGHSTGRPTHR